MAQPEDRTVMALIEANAVTLTEEEMNALPPILFPKNITKSPSLKQFQLLQRYDRRHLITVNS